MKNLLFLSLLLGGLNLNLSAYAASPVTGREEFVLLSEQEEIALGREANKEILQRYDLYGDYRLQVYVNAIGEQLARNSHRGDLVYTFTVLDSNEVNAFALPGGYIYITRGLMAYLNSEAELAAVLGHEIGHVAARHAVRQYTAEMFAKVGVSIGALLIPGLDRTALQITQVLGSAILKGYGREHELEADRLGVEYIAKTNYSANAMLDVIRTLKNQEIFEKQRARAAGRQPRVYHGLFATHPDNDVRLRKIVSHARQYQQTATAQSKVAHYLNHIDGLIFGDDSYNQGARLFRLNIISTDERTNFQTLARQSPLPDDQEARLRLLNGLYPEGEAHLKKYLKIPGEGK